MRGLALLRLAGLIADGQTLSDQELARRLSDGKAREAAVADIVAAGSAKVPRLLSWAKTPPPGVDRTELYVGLAEVFGELKTKESIPFLVEHISIQPWLSSPDVWMKTFAVIEDRLRAVKALIRIGPDAGKAIIGADWSHMEYEDRLAALVVLARLGEGPEARGFILHALGEANLERNIAQDALSAFDKRTPAEK